jgi:hypothetical protein
LAPGRIERRGEAADSPHCVLSLSNLTEDKPRVSSEIPDDNLKVRDNGISGMEFLVPIGCWKHNLVTL